MDKPTQFNFKKVTRHFAFALLSSSVLVACSPATSQHKDTPAASHSVDEVAAETKRLNAWFEEKFEENVAFSPFWQTYLGRKTNYGKIDDFSQDASDKQLTWRKESVAFMKSNFDYDKLTPVAKTSWDIWQYQYDTALASNKFEKNRYVFEQMRAVHTQFPTLLIAVHKVDDASDMEAYISRLSETGRAIDQLIVLSKSNANAGVRPPRFAFESVIESSQKIITGAPFDTEEDSAIWADAHELKNFS